MKVKVKLFASFREASGIAEADVEVTPGTTAAQLWERLLREHPHLVPLSHGAGMALNGRYIRADVPLGEGDVVAYLPPVSGG